MAKRMKKPQVLKQDKARRYAENIISGRKSLLNMINDLLDLAKTEAGKMKLHIEKTSAPELCKVTIASFSLLTKTKKIKIKGASPADEVAHLHPGPKVRRRISPTRAS